jgi:hypothetical protein
VTPRRTTAAGESRWIVHVEQPAQGAQQRRLAGAVRTEQRNDRAGRDLQADAAQYEHHVVVDHLEVAHLQHARPFRRLTVVWRPSLCDSVAEASQ